ncbi:MAG: c-type cytochrome [Granulosicoccus sp.]|nr:c-type cytochrome [Granulosicoccus sp.]
MAHSSAHENNFIKVFIGVLIALTVFTLICVAVARALAPAPDTANDALLRAALLERIEPVGSVNTSEDQVSQPMTAVASVAAPESTDELVQASCGACHTAGVAGAPRFDDADEWAKRRESGLDALVASVINGKGAMPARAGTQYSDEDLRRAVIQVAGFEAESSASGSDDSTEQSADAGELTPRVKGVVDSVCTACHVAGIAGAPKIGDKEAWASRAEKGLEGMAAVVASGKGGMPPRGGSDLSDEELVTAVEYLMSK